MKKTTKTDEAIRIAKPTRSYKKHYLVTLNPFLPPRLLWKPDGTREVYDMPKRNDFAAKLPDGRMQAGEEANTRSKVPLDQLGKQRALGARAERAPGALGLSKQSTPEQRWRPPDDVHRGSP